MISASKKKTNTKKKRSARPMTQRRTIIGDNRRNDSLELTDETQHQNQTAREEEEGKIKIVWLPLYDNPWGKEGYQTGDVLLYGEQRGMGHHETHPPPPSSSSSSSSNRRYKENPFGKDSTYRATHFAPEDGLALICLKRDPLGRLPWGFQPIRDEFGHACLVQSVDPSSPASSAAFLGVPAHVRHSHSVSAASAPASVSTGGGSLRVNDMILAVNGMPVGGMTEVGLELELDLSGPNLLLAVSRYRHAEKAAKEFARMERKILDLMDRAARDDRLMGWREIGNAVEPSTSSPSPSPSPPANSRKTAIVEGMTSPPLPPPPSQSEKPALNMNHEDSGVLQSHKEAGKKSTLDLESPKTTTLKDKGSDSSDAISIGNRERKIRATPSFEIEPEVEGSVSYETSDDSAAHDENPQVGCVCGLDHSSSRVKTFWIQCESCNSWYLVAEDCIGFNDHQAKHPDLIWNCPACIPDAESYNEKTTSNKDPDGTKTSRGNVGNDAIRQEKHRPSSNRLATTVDDTTHEVNPTPVDEKTQQSVASLRNTSDRVETGTSTHRTANNRHQQLTLTSKQSASTSKSAQQPPTTLLLSDTEARKISKISSPNHAMEGTNHSQHSSKPKPPSDCPSEEKQNTLHPKERGRRNTNAAKPLALRELESHNRPGLSYWECFESQVTPFNPSRCLRKRKSMTMEGEQHSIHLNGVGRADASLTRPRNKIKIATSNEMEDESISRLKGKFKTSSRRKRICSTKEQVESLPTERVDPSTAPVVISETPEGAPKSANQILFKEGDLVIVEGHAWAYVNNSGGIGFVQKVHLSEDGDCVYDVKYPVLDRTERMIMGKYISPYSFD